MGLSAHTWVITRDAPEAVSARMRILLPHNARRAWPVMEPDFFGSQDYLRCAGVGQANNRDRLGRGTPARRSWQSKLAGQELALTKPGSTLWTRAPILEDLLEHEGRAGRLRPASGAGGAGSSPAGGATYFSRGRGDCPPLKRPCSPPRCLLRLVRGCPLAVSLGPCLAYLQERLEGLG
jgi:hypothetical protein